MGEFFGSLRGPADGQGRARAMEEKSIAFSRYYNDLAARGMHLRGGDSWPIQRAVVEGYERVIWVYKSVNTIATDSAGLPYRLRRGGEVVDDHPLYRVLNKRANKVESGLVFRKRLSMQVQLSKPGAFVHRIKSNGGSVKELHLLPPDRTEVIPGRDGGIDHWRMTRRDGSYKNFEPDEVLWFRDPHPIDPWSGSTALEAAGMSVQLDHFSRMYNVAFMQNDGRPGGVLAVRKTDGSGGDISETSMNRIEQRFGKGPTEAGKLSVIAGELSYIDLATRPRDMQYGATSANSKVELLATFGMSEVVLGQASGRTFDNADAEMYNYWTRTIPAHNRILLDGFDEDADDDLEGFFDTSGVEVLERAEKAKREEARTEVKDGLRSLRSYAVLAGYGDEIDDNVYTRSVYQANGKTPVPTRTSDIEALGLGGEASTGDAPAIDPATGVDPTAMAAAPATPALGGAEPAAIGAAPAAIGGPEPVAGIDMAALAIKRLGVVEGGDARPKVQFAFSHSRKAGLPWDEDADGEAAQRALEAELSSALGLLADRWVERTLARINAPKQRKGTRHWTPEYDRDTRLGTKALDASKAADEATWQREAEEETSPIVETAAVAAAVALLTSMDVTPPVGETLREMATRVVRQTVSDVVRLIGQSAARQARKMAAVINLYDQDGASIEMIVEQVRQRGQAVQGWSDGVAVQAATGTVNGSRDAAAEAAQVDEGLEVRREWITRRDDKVRASHRGAHGQSRDLRSPFIVGDSLLRYPGDPLAPIHETANCRCRLRYRSRRSGRYVSAETALAAAN